MIVIMRVWQTLFVPCVAAQCLSHSTTLTGANGIYYVDGISVEDTFKIGVGTYVFNQVPTTHPLAFVVDADKSDDFFATTHANGGLALSNTVEGREYEHFDGTVTLTITKAFEMLSFHCYHHGYMRGQHALLYDAACDAASDDDDDDGGGMTTVQIVILSVCLVAFAAIFALVVKLNHFTSPTSASRMQDDAPSQQLTSQYPQMNLSQQ